MKGLNPAEPHETQGTTTQHGTTPAGPAPRRLLRPATHTPAQERNKPLRAPRPLVLINWSSRVAPTGRRIMSRGGIGRGRNWQISPRSSDPQPWKSSQCSFCAQHRCRRSRLRCHAQVWHLFGHGVSGELEDAKTPLCTTWRYGFARSRRDLTICVAKDGACSSRFSRPSCRARAGT